MTISDSFKKRFIDKKIWPRTLSQIFFFALIALISINHTLSESGGGIPFLSQASLHALCPFGGVVSIYQYATAGTFVQKIHESAFILMIIGLFLAVLFGPVFCGWVCPLGSVQEWVGKLGKKLFKRRYNHFIPESLDRILRFARYLVLGWVVYMTAITGTLVFSNIDPYFALFNLWTSEVAIGGVVILAITLSGSLFVERPWCKYACPYGAFIGLSNLVRIFRIAASGKEPIFFLRRGGEMFGLAEVMDSAPRKANAQALTPGVLHAMGRENFERFLAGNFRAAAKVIRILGRRLRYLGEQVGNLMTCDVVTRLAKLLVYIGYDELANEEAWTGPVILPVRLTQEHMAAMTGSCQQTVSEVLGMLQEEGLITVEKRRIVVLRPLDLLRKAEN